MTIPRESRGQCSVYDGHLRDVTGRNAGVSADDARIRRNCLLFVLCGTALVYVVAHFQALWSPYVLNDDVRQQVFWMQRWRDPGLFQDDILARYAEHYVPWGVQAIYFVGTRVMDPMVVSKILTGLLMVTTAGFLFGLVLEFGNVRAAVFVVCMSFFFTSFIRKMSGGLSQGFAYPLLLAYLFFLARGSMWAMSLTILLASVLNPYMCILCLATHALFLGRLLLFSSSVEGSRHSGKGALVAAQVPVVAAMVLMALKYVLLTPPEFGGLVTWSEMVGNPEYTAAGRLEIIPVPSLVAELIRPWLDVFPVAEWGPISGWVGGALVAGTCAVALACPDKGIALRGFRPFIYLLPASFCLYGISYTVLLELFLPERYLEFSLNILYCVILGLSMSIIGRRLGMRRHALSLIPVVVMLVAAGRIYGVGVYDYSTHADLYRFLQSTGKDTVIAGHPELMDNVLVFSQRRVFVSHELSHTWVRQYWSAIKERTTELFTAYYAQDPGELVRFCAANRIDYFVVRDEDFSRERLNTGTVYFEPFGSMIRELTGSRSCFAALDREIFSVVYERKGIRVLKIDTGPSSLRPGPARRPIPTGALVATGLCAGRDGVSGWSIIGQGPQ